MCTPGVARAVAVAAVLVGALASSACGFDESGSELGIPEASAADTLEKDAPSTLDAPGSKTDSHAPTDGAHPEDHTIHDGADDHGESKDGGPTDGHTDASDGRSDSPADSATDSSSGDGAKDSSGGDGGADSASDSSTDSGGSDGGIAYTCGSGTTTDCLTGCPTSPVTCYLCGAFSSKATFCGDQGDTCFDFGYGNCGCLSASDCVVSEQTCVFFGCTGCGEPGSDGEACKGGGKCDEASATCL